MIKIAVTGSYASGKTHILEHVATKGFYVFSCDSYIKTLYQKPDIKDNILKLLPDLKIFDTQEIKKIIYSDTEARKKLEAFIHPIVRDGFEEFCFTHNSSRIIFAEVPLLFETGFDKYFSYVITTFCSENTRKIRAQTRDFFDQQIYDKIENIQYSQFQKILLSRFNINTDLSTIELQDDIDQLIKRLEWLEK